MHKKKQEGRSTKEEEEKNIGMKRNRKEILKHTYLANLP